MNDSDSPAAAANGQYLLIRRQVYEQIGGHAAVRGEVLEDGAVARMAKAAGFRLHFAPGDDICRVRMYSRFKAMGECWAKDLLPFVAMAGQRGAGRSCFCIPCIPL